MAVASLALCTIVILTYCGGSVGDETNDKAASAMNNFGIKLYKEFIKTKENLFCSGFSIAILLNMLLVGARTDTATEISNVLGNNAVGLSQSEMENWIHGILTQERGNQTAYELDIANSIWIHQNFHVLPEFKSKMVDTFYAEEEEVTFGTPEATNKINSWVSKETKGKIPKLFNEPLDNLVRLVLVNAMYFNGTWEYKFNPNNTNDHAFHYNNGQSSKDIKMMRIEQRLLYTESEELNAQLLELPYNGEVSMVIALPNENNGLTDLENNLTFETLKRAMNEMKSDIVRVKFPKFETKSDLPLIGALQAMGIQKAFIEGGADLSGIDGSQELFVSKALQKAVVEVSEEGTIAAVASAVVTSIRSSAKVEIKRFTADHPFIYLIRHNPSGLVLFMGRLVQP